jgi:alkanesulfonate monooxygenase SsuD/methylene tetrahydromethanopterin reductase-like flavin-dependent oxidoreductase (luciferase family)
MQLAIQVRNDFNYVLRSARWAEDNGLVALGLPDHYLARGSEPERPGYDHLIHLAGLARETSRLELCLVVAPVTFRHPAVLYKAGVTLDEISGGRFTLGVGTGWLDEEFTLFGLPYPDLGERFELLEEAMEYLRNAITPGAHGFDGEHYRLAEFDPYPHPENLRLLVGGGGKVKTPRIAGRFADEYNIYACPPDDYREKAETARDHARKAGRDPETILFSTACPAVAAAKESDYRRLLEQLAQLTGQETAHIEKTYDERGYPHGYGSKPAEMLAALEEAGCQRFYVQAFAADVDDYEIIFEALED